MAARKIPEPKPIAAITPSDRAMAPPPPPPPPPPGPPVAEPALGVEVAGTSGDAPAPPPNAALILALLLREAEELAVTDADPVPRPDTELDGENCALLLSDAPLLPLLPVDPVALPLLLPPALLVADAHPDALTVALSEKLKVARTVLLLAVAVAALCRAVCVTVQLPLPDMLPVKVMVEVG